MSEASDEFERLEEEVNEFLSKTLREEYEKLIKRCEDRFVGSNGNAFCGHPNSSLADCSFSICPRKGIPLDMTSRHPEKTGEGTIK